VYDHGPNFALWLALACWAGIVGGVLLGYFFAMSDHHCHALGCKNPCPPAHLMCRSCWWKVPGQLRNEVNRTVGMRGETVDASWAPWWRAQARAISHVAFLKSPIVAKRDAYLARELAFADTLESR